MGERRSFFDRKIKRSLFFHFGLITFISTAVTAPLTVNLTRYLDSFIEEVEHIAYVGGALALFTNFLQSIVSLVMILVFTYFLIFKPIRKLQNLMQKIATGDLNEDKEKYPKNILGDLAADVHSMMDRNRTLLSEVAALTEQLKKSSGTLSTGTKESNMASEHIAYLSQGMVDASNQQTVAIEQMTAHITSAMEKLTETNAITRTLEGQAMKTVEEIHDGERQLGGVVQDINSVKDSVNNLEENISELNKGIQQINEIVEMISNISNQTNLLALNAAIEAARAGEEGRGFAVVADEIRKLSEQTQSFTTEIQSKVEMLEERNTQTLEAMASSHTSVQKGVQSVVDTEGKIKGMLVSTEEVIKLARNISMDVQNLHKQTLPLIDETKKISNISHNNVKSINEVAASLQEQSAQASEIENISKQLETYADKLNKQISNFKL